MFTEMGAESLDRFQIFICRSSYIWVGLIDGVIVCGWGLVPLSLLSERAYIWLFTNDNLKSRSLPFLRAVRRTIATMLQIYPSLIGEVVNDDARAKRWLAWAGADFGPQGQRLTPFLIERPHD